MMRVSIIIPTYNEAKNLPLLVEEIFSLLNKTKIDGELIVVDDNSKDGTGAVAEVLKRKYSIKVKHRPQKLGLGSAVIEGFGLSDREYVGVMDADLSHDAVILNDLILALDEHDIVLGSRFAVGGAVENWPLFRKAISKAGTFLARIFTNVRDPLSGYFFLKKDVISGVELKTSGYKILLEILVKGKYKTVKELPFIFRAREFSASKLNYKEFLLFLKQILEYGWYRMRKIITVVKKV